MEPRRLALADYAAYAVGTSSSPEGVAFDGTSIWVANYGSANLSRILK